MESSAQTGFRFPDLATMFDFTFGLPTSQDSDVVRVVDLFDLERSDVDVTRERDIVTVKGEYGADLDATRVFEQFRIPDGLDIKRVHFVKRSEGMNRLVFVFDQIDHDKTSSIDISE
jgi:hypothetical protein